MEELTREAYEALQAAIEQLEAAEDHVQYAKRRYHRMLDQYMDVVINVEQESMNDPTRNL